VKKTLLASAITLTYLGFATSSAVAEEHQVQTTVAETKQQTTTDKVEKNTPSTEVKSSVPTPSTTNPNESQTNKEANKTPEVQKDG